MATTKDPTARVIRNLIRMQRAGTSITAEGRRALDQLFARLEADLRRFDPTGVAKRYRALRRDRYFRVLAERVREWLPDFDRALRDGLVALGREQAEFAADTLVVSLGGKAAAREVAGLVRPGITQQRARAILNAEPFEGRVLRDHARKIGANVVDRTMVEVRIGMVNEEALPQMVSRVRGILGRSTRETEAVVRTAVTFMSGRGQEATFKENAEILEGVQFSATLDDQTTEGCLALDGTIWPVGSPDIVMPGYHWGCRSALVPVVDWKALGLRPPPPGERAARDVSALDPADLRRKVSARARTGDLGKRIQVPADMTGAQWLRGQSAAVQNKVLGRGKAELFRSGEATLKDLVRRDRTSRPLKEVLRRLEPK